METSSDLYFDEELHEYYYKGIQIPSVHAVMECNGYVDYSFANEEAMDRGTLVHTITEWVDKGINDYNLIPHDIVPYVTAYEEFINDYEPKITWSEMRRIGIIDNMMYGGTIDRVFNNDGNQWVLDIKTGYYAKFHPVQIAAYCNTLTKDTEGSCLYLNKNGTYKLKNISRGDMEIGFNLFKAALYKWWYTNKRDWNKLIKVLDHDN